MNKYWNSRFRTNMTWAFDWCMNCHISMRKNFGPFLPNRGDPYHKKSPNFFLIEIWKFIHQSKARVEFSRNMLLLNFFEVISGQKNLKNYVKICLFKWSFEISCFGTKISKKWRFLIILKAENHFANYILQNELLIVAFGCVLTVI